MNPQNHQGKHATFSLQQTKEQTPPQQQKPRSESLAICDRTSDRQNPRQKEKSKGRRSELFSISDSPPYLQIQSVPIDQRVDPQRNSYILLIQPVGIRAAAGQYSADEAEEIAKATRGWDWSLDKDGKPQCLQRLEALLSRICKRSGHSLEVNSLHKTTCDDVNRIEESNSLFTIEAATAPEHLCLPLSKTGGAS